MPGACVPCSTELYPDIRRAVPQTDTRYPPWTFELGPDPLPGGLGARLNVLSAFQSTYRFYGECWCDLSA